MTKSELIERLASQQSHIPAKAVEDAVKEMLEHMASTLAQGERIEIRVSAVSLCIIEHLAPGVTRRLAIKLSWKVSTFRTLSLGKNYATAPIFTKSKLRRAATTYSDDKKSTSAVLFLCPQFALPRSSAPVLQQHRRFCASRNPHLPADR